VYLCRFSLVTSPGAGKVSGGWTLGSSAAIAVDPATGVPSAGADPRVDACALAW
jgi:hypothetical protein